ncbi:hypothetical protein [Lebetimonas sp. JS032]|uniref:hypothetical protein n=1 Tax=Lebetimonas sp. JS032 TaxID=990070 RepID=UPI0004649C2C|nr:hypothetical protein [Lebetimonas sp. JS032]
MKRFFFILKNSFKELIFMLPLFLAVIGLVGLFQVFVSKDLLASFFSGNPVTDTLSGTVAGAVAVGQAIVSYIIGGELLKEGVSMYAVSSFILAWVTLGIVQLPAEAEILGVKFTVYRNLLSFIFTIIVSVSVVLTLKSIN